MDNNWIEDALHQNGGEASFESFREISLQPENRAEENDVDFNKAQQHAKAQKKMFNAADYLIEEGYDSWQVLSMLQDHIGVTTNDLKDMETIIRPSDAATT